MPRITFIPSQRSIECKPGESILEAALRNGIQIAHACGGFGACATCHVAIPEGGDHLLEMTEKEEEQLDRATHVTLHSRLACQCRILEDRGEITVEIMNPEEKS